MIHLIECTYVLIECYSKTSFCSEQLQQLQSSSVMDMINFSDPTDLDGEARSGDDDEYKYNSGGYDSEEG